MKSKEALKKGLESPVAKARGGVYLNIETIKQMPKKG